MRRSIAGVLIRMFLSIKRHLQLFQWVRLRGWIAIIAVEILVVVLGFYIGLGLSSWGEEAERRDRLTLMVGALSTEIGTFVEDSSDLIESVRDDFYAWKNAYERGQRPPPFVLAATGFLARPHTTLWVAIIDDGGLELLPLDLVTRLADFYERSDRMLERYNLVSSYSREHVLPYLDVEPSPFYAPDKTELREGYRIHMLELEAVIRYATDTISLGREIRAHPFFADND